MKRSIEQITRHYTVERQLSDRLRAASRAERRMLYTAVYNELFSLVPDHPQNVMKTSPRRADDETSRQFSILRSFINPNMTYLEIGAGDCSLAVQIANEVKRVYALEVSDEIARGVEFPCNFTLLLTDGVEIPVPPGSVDIVYSNQLMEHLHADDAFEQLSQVFRALRPGGVYLCITPNRLGGPHDISQYFDSTPRGFHLREYSNADLVKIFTAVGFRRFRFILNYKGLVLYAPIPLWPVLMYEKAIARLPSRLRKLFAYPLIGVKFIGYKV